MTIMHVKQTCGCEFQCGILSKAVAITMRKMSKEGKTKACNANHGHGEKICPIQRPMPRQRTGFAERRRDKAEGKKRAYEDPLVGDLLFQALGL